MTASSSAVSGALRPEPAADRAASAAWVSSSRAPNRRLRRATQPSSAPPSPVVDISPLEKVQPEFVGGQYRERQHESNSVIKQPEDHQSRQQRLCIELPERNQHGGVEHA